MYISYVTSGRLAESLALGNNTVEQRDPAPLVAHRIMGCTLFCMGELGTAREHLEQLNALYDPTRHQSLTWLYGNDPGMTGRLWLARTLWLLGYPDGRACRSAARVAVSERDPTRTVWHMAWYSPHGRISTAANGIRCLIWRTGPRQRARSTASYIGNLRLVYRRIRDRGPAKSPPFARRARVSDRCAAVTQVSQYSVTAQDDRWVGGGRAPGRQAAGDAGRDQENKRGQADHERIGRADSEQQGSQISAHGEGSSDSG